MTKGIFVTHGRLQVECAVVSQPNVDAEQALQAHPGIQQLLQILCSPAEVRTLQNGRFVTKRRFKELAATLSVALRQTPSQEAGDTFDRCLEYQVSSDPDPGYPTVPPPHAEVP